MEKRWITNFNVMVSKDNSRIHTKYKQFFDKPVAYMGHTQNGFKSVNWTMDIGTWQRFAYVKAKRQLSKDRTSVHEIPFLRTIDDPNSG